MFGFCGVKSARDSVPITECVSLWQDLARSLRLYGYCRPLGPRALSPCLLFFALTPVNQQAL